MKHLLYILIFLPFSAQSQINIYSGYGQLKGLTGIEAQYKDVSLSLGYIPAQWYFKSANQSFSGAVTFYQDIEKETYYLSMGVTSSGISHYENGCLNSEPSVMAMVGTRFYLKDIDFAISRRWKIDCGIGVNHIQGCTLLTWELLINFTLIK